MASTMPDTFVAGTTVKFTTAFGSTYPANQSWTAALYLIGGSASGAINGSASGVDFNFTISAATSAAWLPGNYSWEVRVSKSGEVYIADSGVVEVQPNLSTATAGSLLSWAEETLPLADAAITALVSGNVASYQIGNRSFVKQDLDKLLRLKSYCESKIRSERNPGAFLDTVNVEFSDPDA